MITPAEFDEIRPYTPEELPAVFEELIADPQFRTVVQSVIPDTPFDQLAARLRTCRTNQEVQLTFFYPLLCQLEKQCTAGIRLSAPPSLHPAGPYTFISNHRDIVLDSAFLSKALIDNHFDRTVEIAIGDNLLIHPWIKRLVRVNKSFIVQRSVSMRQMLESSARMSRYMHFAIREKRENIWIAQREGRAKDSNDQTQDSVLKMMAMGGEGTPAERLKALHLVPLSISYEYDPCDYLNAKEFQQKRDIEGFRKSREDDLLNMQTGIFGQKGQVRYKAAPCLDDWLDSLDATMPKGTFFATVARRIDTDIHCGYHLFPGNYVAADLLEGGTTTRATHYTETQRQQFEHYLQTQLSRIDLPHPDIPFLRECLLRMYANPLYNAQKANAQTPSEA